MLSLKIWRSTYFVRRYESKNVFVFSSFYCNMICFIANTNIDCIFSSVPRSAQLLSLGNISSMSLPGFRDYNSSTDTFGKRSTSLYARRTYIKSTILANYAKTFIAKHRILSQASNVEFSFPVSAVYAWNAWDHDPPFGEEHGCIF